MEVVLQDPREKLQKEMAKIQRRLAMLDKEESRFAPITQAVKESLPEHLSAEVEVQAQLSWDKQSEHVSVEVTVKNLRIWSDLDELFSSFQLLGYALEDWTSIELPKYFRRCYSWNNGYEKPFGIVVNADLDEAATECKRVLVRVEHHSGQSYKEEIYAFDCGEGAEEVIRKANAGAEVAGLPF